MTTTRKLIAGGLIAAAIVVLTYPTKSATKSAPAVSPEMDATREALRKATKELDEYTAGLVARTRQPDPEYEAGLKAEVDRLASEFVRLRGPR